MSIYIQTFKIYFCDIEKSNDAILKSNPNINISVNLDYIQERVK